MSHNGISITRLVYGTSLKRTLLRAAVLAGVCLIVAKFVLIPVKVDGASMAPTYAKKGVNFVNRLAYLRHPPHRGDVVAVRFRETGSSIYLMKRVVGLPGETIGFEDGVVTVNGRKLEEPYLKFDSNWNRTPVVCSPDEYFVVGDNRSMPMEDHSFGKARESLIAGKMML